MKRYYYPNRTVKTEGYTLEVSTGGTVYYREEGALRTLDSLWLQRIGVLLVTLPNGNMVRLKPGKDGIKVVNSLAEIMGKK